ncbi:MAG: hypothetical protein ACKO3W_12030 [bacterium]
MPMPRSRLAAFAVALFLPFGIALGLGIIATVLCVVLPLGRVDRGAGGQLRHVHRGEYEWFHATDHVFGLTWSNLQLAPTRMVTPLVEGELPSWGEPPPPPYPSVAFLRIGTLAAGWPFHAVAFRWMVTTTDRNFPAYAELDDGDTSIGSAAESVLTGGRGGPPNERRLLWPGLLADFAFYTLAAFALVSTLPRVARWVRPVRPARPASAKRTS